MQGVNQFFFGYKLAMVHLGASLLIGARGDSNGYWSAPKIYGRQQMNRKLWAVIALLAAVIFSYQPAWSQATISTGSIQGTITDPQGAVVTNAQVRVSSQAGGKSVAVATND